MKHWCHPSVQLSKEGGFTVCPRRNGRTARRRQRTRSVHARPRRRCCMRALAREMATRSSQVVWAVSNGVMPQCCPPVGCYGGSAAAKHAGAGGPGRHRRQEGAKRACGAPDKQARRRATCQGHCGRVTETDELKMTLKLNFLNFEQ